MSNSQAVVECAKRLWRKSRFGRLAITKASVFLGILFLFSCTLFAQNDSSDFIYSHYNFTDEDLKGLKQSLVDSPLQSESIAVIIDILNKGRGQYVPDGMKASDIYSGNSCAMAVNRMFWQIFGNEDDLETARGVSGNAWNLEENLRVFGGEVLWTKRESSSALYKGGEVYPFIDKLEVGDILGFYYHNSLYNDDIDLDKAGHQINPVGYTHLALVLAVDPHNGPAITHLYLVDPNVWPLRFEYLTDYLDAFDGVFEVHSILRPGNKGTRTVPAGEIPE